MQEIGKISRRYYLKGAFGTALALPFLELLHSRRANAQAGANTNFIVCYAGQAMGGDTDSSVHRFRPEAEGRLADMQALPLSLQPLGGREMWTGEYVHPRHGAYVEPIRNWPGDVVDVRQLVSVISGLQIKQDMGPAHAATFEHRGSISPALSGTSSTNKAAVCNGPTSDVLAEEAFGTKALRCLVQAGSYGNPGSGDGGHDNAMSWGHNREPIIGQISPKAMFRGLFESFTPELEGSPADQAARAQLLARRSGILDLTLAASQRLNTRLGMEDKQRLQAHMDGIATLQRRVTDLGLAQGEGCALPLDPGEDPPYAGGVGGDRGGQNHAVGEGWSQEEKRAVAFIDMLTMALACGMTRVGTVMFSHSQSFLNGEDPTGLLGDQHQIGHGGMVERANGSVNDSVALCHHYPVRYFGYLVSRLAATVGTSGRSLLEDTAAGLVFEAGHGLKGSIYSAHSGEEMCALVAGGAGGLRQGEHIRLANEHPARVLTSMMKAAGAGSRLGEIDGVIDRLFV